MQLFWGWDLFLFVCWLILFLRNVLLEQNFPSLGRVFLFFFNLNWLIFSTLSVCQQSPRLSLPKVTALKVLCFTWPSNLWTLWRQWWNEKHMGFGITQALGPVHLWVSPAVIWDESFHFSVLVSSFKSCGNNAYSMVLSWGLNDIMKRKVLSTWCIKCSKTVLRLCLFILYYVALCQSSKLNQLSLTFNQKKLNQMANLENSLLYKE